MIKARLKNGMEIAFPDGTPGHVMDNAIDSFVNGKMGDKKAIDEVMINAEIRNQIGVLIKAVEANDPKEIKAEIANLNVSLAKELRNSNTAMRKEFKNALESQSEDMYLALEARFKAMEENIVNAVERLIEVISAPKELIIDKQTGRPTGVKIKGEYFANR
jgi:hypothetical protein